MGDIVNLRTVRKQRERATREAEAAANRSRFGRTKGQKRQDADDAARARRDLDGKRLERPDDVPDGVPGDAPGNAGEDE